MLAEGAVVYFFSQYPLVFWPLGGIGLFVLGFVTIFDAATNYAETAATLRIASTLCDDLKIEVERLWRGIESYRIGDDEAEENYNRIVDHWSRATRTLTLETHHHDNVIAAKAAYEIVLNRYAQ